MLFSRLLHQRICESVHSVLWYSTQSNETTSIPVGRHASLRYTLSPGQGWYRSAKAQNSTKAPLTGNPNQLGLVSFVFVFASHVMGDNMDWWERERARFGSYGSQILVLACLFDAVVSNRRARATHSPRHLRCRGAVRRERPRRARLEHRPERVARAAAAARALRVRGREIVQQHAHIILSRAHS